MQFRADPWCPIPGARSLVPDPWCTVPRTGLAFLIASATGVALDA